MKSIAIIPARGGSKRLPRKNIRDLGGKSLVEHTLDAAQNSECFNRILLSSDDNEILEKATLYANVEPIRRPERLSGDRITALDLVCDITSDESIQKEFDTVALLLPTAPFRNANHIQAGYKLLTLEIDGVISLTTFEFPPQLSVKLEDGLISPVYDPSPLVVGNTRSQDQQTIYRPNGGFYIKWMKSFIGHKNFWKGKISGYLMGRLDSVDIDNELDFRYAQFLWENRQ